MGETPCITEESRPVFTPSYCSAPSDAALGPETPRGADAQGQAQALARLALHVEEVRRTVSLLARAPSTRSTVRPP